MNARARQTTIIHRLVVLATVLAIAFPTWIWAEPTPGGALTPQAAEAVAAIGSNEYESLQQAVDAAQAGDTVVLLRDTKENVSAIDKTFTLDLGDNVLVAQETGTYYYALKLEGGNVTIKNGTLRGGYGGGRFDAGQISNVPLLHEGGGVYATNAQVNIEDVTFTKGNGSAVIAIGGTLRITNSAITGFDGTRTGYNLIHLMGGSLTMTDSQITDNVRPLTALAILGGATATVEGCTISGNTNAVAIGGILVGSTDKGTLTLRNSTVLDNTGLNAGGIWVAKGKFVMEDSAVSGNAARGGELGAANDIGVANWDAGSIIQQADTMKGEYAHYVWDDRTRFITTAIGHGDVSAFPLELTATENNPNDPVAEYDGQTYNSLSGAVRKAIEDNQTDGQDKQVKLLKDTKDSVVIQNGDQISGTIDVDLGGFMVEGKDLNTPIAIVNGGGSGTIVFRNGQFANGRTGTVYNEQGGALRFRTDDSVTVRLKDMDIRNNQACSIRVATKGTFAMENCTVSNPQITEDGRVAIYIEKAKEATFTDCVFEDGNRVLFTSGIMSQRSKVTLANCQIINNRPPALRFTDSIVEVAEYSDVTMTNCDLSNNSFPKYSAGTDYLVKVLNGATLTMDGCRVMDNELAYEEESESAPLYLAGTTTIKNTEIRRNKAGAAGAIYRPHNYPSRDLELRDVVIEGNVAAGYTTSKSHNVSGGIVLEDDWGGWFDYYAPVENCAIYNNTVENVPAGEYMAHDLYVGESVTLTMIPVAANMKDGEFDFSQKVWKDGATTGYDENPSMIRAYPRYYSVVDRGNVSNVAKIEGKGEFATLREAIDAAENGDTITLIAQEQNVVTKTVAIDKNVTLDLAGHNIVNDRFASNDTAITVENGAHLTVTDTQDPKPAKLPAIKYGGIEVEEAGQLTIDAELEDLSVTNRGRVSVATCPKTLTATLVAGATLDFADDCDVTGKTITVELDEETAAKYNNAKQSDAIPVGDLVIAKNAPADLGRCLTVSNVTNGRVIEAVKDGNLVLTLAKAVYVDGINGFDALDGANPETAVRTFAQAKRLMEARNADCIMVVNTIPVTGAQTWDLNGKELRRYSAHTGNLVQVRAGGSLSLTDIVIDGQRHEMNEKCQSLIKVEKNAALTIAEGTELRNNDISKKATGDTPVSTIRGGAVDSAGDITMTGGSIHDNVAGFGGGIYQSYGTFTFTGGDVSNNRADDTYYNGRNRLSSTSELHNGGGIMLAYGALLNMEGDALVQNNYADGSGGGISLGCRVGSYTDTRYSNGKATTINMNGGTIDGNNGAAGGGLCVQDYAVANVGMGKTTRGLQSEPGHIYITNNTARKSAAYIGGGGIYVNGTHITGNNYTSGVLNIKNVEMTGNSSAADGAAIATCGTSEIYIRDLENAVIYDNESYTAGGNGAVANNQIALTSRTMTADLGWADLAMRGDSTVSKYILGGGEYNWTYPSGTPIPDDQLDHITKTMYLVSDPDPAGSDVAKGKALAKVHINGNSAPYGTGGGIGINGLMYMGSYRDFKNITVTKEWAGDVAEKPISIKVVLKQDGAIYDTVILEPDNQGRWPSHTFEDLPVYKLDGTGKQTTEEHLYTIEEDMTYAPPGGQTTGEVFVSEVSQGATTSQAVRSTDDPAYAGKSIATENYTILNNIKPEDYLEPVSVDPPVAKVIKGNPTEKEAFTFMLTPVSNTAGLAKMPMPNGQDATEAYCTVSGAGQKEFGPITFKEAGVYEYEVSEIDDQLPGYTYDDSVWRIRFDVEEKEGKLTATQTNFKNGAPVADISLPTFVNIYEPDRPGKVKKVPPKTGDRAQAGTAAALLLTACGVLVATRRRKASTK